ncbi:hypothetical protein IGK15_001621 [Enterococcus sp. AZ045]|uniref:DUF6414 family protein n=1 Tax=Enterococcus sp. AZ045 TaxID=2774807 RepID=UPI003F2393E5
MATSKQVKQKKIIKVVYFDEGSASDYITIHNGGQIDWSTEDNKEKLAKIVAEIDAQAKGGFNFFSAIKTSVSGRTSASIDANTSKLINSTLTNSLLTDYIEIADNDENIKQIHNDSVYAPKDSVSIYKMYSSYLDIVPKSELPFDVQGLNNALLNERGYYQMLLMSEQDPTCVLRFNINAFKNDYSLADLSKMSLSYFGVNVGKCTLEQLSIKNEFEVFKEKTKPSAQAIVEGIEEENGEELLNVYDIVLAGVRSE